LPAAFFLLVIGGERQTPAYKGGFAVATHPDRCSSLIPKLK
jgi:hypothetical protein